MPGDAFNKAAMSGPPPSTLAAQLVENISASAKSSKSDEENQLKGFFTVIQRVKDDPSLLKTPAERIEHNHMLIYVYSRVVLEGIKFDDPFLDQTHVRVEGLKAINFFKFVIKETPGVLTYKPTTQEFLFRGEEPLWVWLLPQLLRLLGQPKCVELIEGLESLVQYFLLVVAQTPSLWELAPEMLLYLRTTVSCIISHLQNPSTLLTHDNSPISLSLPPSYTLERFLHDRSLSYQFTYHVDRVSQAIQQIKSLSNILFYPLLSSDPAFQTVTSFSESAIWLLDTLIDMRTVERRWHSLSLNSSIRAIQTMLDVAKAPAPNRTMSPTLWSKAITLLILLCSEMVSSPDESPIRDTASQEEQRIYCAALAAIVQASVRDRSLSRLAASKLADKTLVLYPTLSENTDVWRTIQTLRQVTSPSFPEVLEARIHPSSYHDEEIRKEMEALSLSYEEPESAAPGSAKRRKILKESSENVVSVANLVRECLNVAPKPNQGKNLSQQEVLDVIQRVDESHQCLAIELLSRTCCLPEVKSNGADSPLQRVRNFECPICDAKPSGERTLVKPGAPTLEVQIIFEKIVRLPELAESRRSRVAAMLALRRLLLHSNDQPGLLDLETSILGQWCLQSLNSSVRELRLAAGRLLATFSLDRPLSPPNQDIIKRNRKNSIAFLRSISDKNQANIVESCILAWGQLGRVVSDDEVNLVLIKLLEYLGSSNNVVSAFAFNELLNLADSRHTTPRRLFEPFWPSLAYMATKDMVHRPQMSRVIAELLQISVNELLLLVQAHALPWLVLDKQVDVIQKIAEARNETDCWQPLMDSANQAAILALLLVQDVDDMEGFAKSRLDAISEKFHPMTLVELIQSESVLVAMELLKASAEADETRKPTIRKALHTVATMMLATNKKMNKKKGNPIGRFLKSQILGLMARLTDIINDSVATPPIQEQRRCIYAMEEMIRMSKDYASIARPQMSACLLFALTQDPLRDASFSCWAAMITYLEEDDVEALLETTFFIVDRYWTSFSSDTSATAKRILNFMLDHYESMVLKYISRLPSLKHLAGLKEVESRLKALRPTLLVEEALEVFSDRIHHENSGVVLQALTELVQYLHVNQSALHTSTIGQQPDTTIAALMRSLLDCACKYNGFQSDISRLCTEAMGLIGCLDSNKVETVREQRSIVVLHNFEKGEETTDFVIFLLQEVLVPSFLSATDVRLQGFLSFAMQELLERSDITAACAMQKSGMLDGAKIYQKWMTIPEPIRDVLSPFITSRYMVAAMVSVKAEYPIFRPGRLYGNWLKSLVLDLLRKGQNPCGDMIFEPLSRVIRVKDVSTAEFLLPYLVMHVLLGSRSTEKEKDDVVAELLGILQHQPTEHAPYREREEMKLYCHAVFRVIDYALRLIQTMRAATRPNNYREKIQYIQRILDSIPAELISQRAIDCGEYSRALFHLEQHAQKMEQQKREPGDRTRLLERLQDIYAHIDEPDGLDGISSQLPVLDINQQVLSQRKAGRWTAVQSWYEMKLAESPDNVDVKVDLLNCLKQSGQYDVLLNQVEGMQPDSSTDNRIIPFAVEAAWVTGRWPSLSKFTKRFYGNAIQDFNVSLATIFDSLHRSPDSKDFLKTIQEMRETISAGMSTSATTSLQACHDHLLKCHVLTDLEIIFGAKSEDEASHRKTMTLLDRRLEVIGAYVDDKQYILGIRRAAMELSRPTFSDVDISGLWLASARLARKTNSLRQSFNAILHASRLGDDAATIENAKLLWREDQHRKAIQVLQGAIQGNKFMTQTGTATSTSTSSTKLNSQQKLLTARAQLLLAKWLDTAGQTHAGALREKYQQPPKTHSTWEKGHYYLGRHYKKILESEKPLKADDQSDNFVTGEIARLVIENYVRSLNSGTKYVYQTLPRILTLWLDLGAQVDKPPEGKVSLSRELHRRRVQQLDQLHGFLDKYILRLPAYIFYTALPQIVARIAHQNVAVFERLTRIIVKVVEAHPQQALWSLIGIMTTRQVTERKARGTQILTSLRSISRKVEGSSYDLKNLLRMGERLAEQLLLACTNGDFHGNKTVRASLTRDLRFNQKCTPCPLVVPVEASLTATLPAVSEYVKKHKAFSRDVVTIESFQDDVLVLSSLAKPRRLTARGTDGKAYMLLVKPKDDLRTDQRLMEFNGLINRSLKRDAESSRRQLYIRTYAVTPLNEECGIIEWVPGIKTMRDILLGLYASRKIQPDYNVLKQLMDEACMSDGKTRIFTDEVLGRFPPLLQLWFTQQFPNPSAWFSARLRYTRSCAVMSMVGTILGLGDRHGENVNLEEGNGGVFHVDFNCLFDKGLTFAKPERVPFRLTHNMVAAMGIYGVEGPFRKSCELTLSILRQQEETLMTILEAFIYDPTLDLQKEKRTQRRGDAGGIKLQPQSVVDSIKRKVKGLLPNESIPLGVEGQVEELIKQAVDPKNLAAMYIGWCPFL